MSPAKPERAEAASLAALGADWAAVGLELDPADSGLLNIAHVCVDRHVEAGCGDAVAVRWLGRNHGRGEITYGALANRAGQVARVLADLGIAHGDTVAVLLDRVPDLYAVALGIWKVGAVYCPLSGHFGPGPLRARMEISGAKALVASAELYGRKLSAQRDSLAGLAHVLLVSDGGGMVSPLPPECLDFHTLVDSAAVLETRKTGRTDPAFLHFTSGTTGNPKGVVHSHCAVAAHLLTARQVFGLGPDDVFWCTADPGWVTGTAYGIIAPLASGATLLADEMGVEPRRWYGILHDEKVTAWYTTPTAIRAMMRFGAALARSYRENSLRVAASVGEPLNAEAVAWGAKALGVPFLDTWWQTETGAIVIANDSGGNRRAGSMGRPLPGAKAALVQCGDTGLTVVNEADAVGELALGEGWPSMCCRTLGGDSRTGGAYQDGWYLTGDLVRRDADGYFWFVGRADDMIKCAGQQIGPFELESTLMDHPAVAEVGVVGKPDLLEREVPVAFAALNPGFEAGDALRAELLSFARQELGSAMAPREIHFIADLPKTSTGKILRRALKAKAMGEPEGGDILSSMPPCPGRYDDE